MFQLFLVTSKMEAMTIEIRAKMRIATANSGRWRNRNKPAIEPRMTADIKNAIDRGIGFIF
jgi:hypothetical protein